MPNILLVYPKFPLSYWGFRFAMDFVGRKACMPPLGLVTVAALFAPRYNAAPSQSLPVILNTQPQVIQPLVWGLRPTWLKQVARREGTAVKVIKRDYSLFVCYTS
jgi:putative SOS response-associated peptidase YedK